MKDKKELNEIQLRQNALDIVGGKNTIEGRNIINEINKFNPIINLEADLREEKGIATGPLDKNSYDTVVNNLVEKLSDMDPTDIRKLNKKFFQDSMGRDAILKTFDTPQELSDLLENAPKEMKQALKNYASGNKNKQGGGSPKGPVGFVPPGSTVNPGGTVSNP